MVFGCGPRPGTQQAWELPWMFVLDERPLETAEEFQYLDRWLHPKAEFKIHMEALQKSQSLPLLGVISWKKIFLLFCCLKDHSWGTSSHHGLHWTWDHFLTLSSSRILGRAVLGVTAFETEWGLSAVKESSGVTREQILTGSFSQVQLASTLWVLFPLLIPAWMDPGGCPQPRYSPLMWLLAGSNLKQHPTDPTDPMDALEHSPGTSLLSLPSRVGPSQITHCRQNLTEDEDIFSVSMANMHSKSCWSVNCLEALFSQGMYLFNPSLIRQG